MIKVGKAVFGNNQAIDAAGSGKQNGGLVHFLDKNMWAICGVSMWHSGVWNEAESEAEKASATEVTCPACLSRLADMAIEEIATSRPSI